MKRRLLLLPVVALLPLLGTAPSQENPLLVAPTGPRTPAEEKKGFKLPPGFDVELVAAEPDINKPMNLAFDSKGRLWVTSTVEYPYPAPADRKPRDAVKVLEDFGPDGRARKITTFADEFNIPIGVLPLDRGALVFGIPSIFHLDDTDNDGKADKRRALYEKYGFRDTHGMTNSFSWGFDGWVYACHGFNNDSTVKAADGSAVTMNSGNVYRMKADGSHIEQFTWGQVNPFGLSFDPMGNLYSADCHSRAVYQLLRGAWYPSFAKPHDGLGFGPEMTRHDHGSTGIAGVSYYAADHFPKEYQGGLFVGNVVSSRVHFDELTWRGSSPWVEKPQDFLRSEDPWFRPVDLKLGPDGALYIADFYNKIIGHYEVPLTHPGRDRERGRIWRVVYRGLDGKGKPSAPRADWTKTSVKELVEDLAHPNLTVRTFATNQLVERGGEEGVNAVKALMDEKSTAFQRVHGLWVLHRRDALDEEILTELSRDKQAIVRVHVLRVLAEKPMIGEKLRKLALTQLKDKDPNVTRAAVEALGRHAHAEHLPALIQFRDQTDKADTHLTHTIRMALRDHVRDLKVWKFPEGLGEEEKKVLADVTLGIPGRDASGLIMHSLDAKLYGAKQYEAVRHVARHGDDKTTGALQGFVRKSPAEGPEHQVRLFQALERGTTERGGKLDGETVRWASALVERLFDSGKAPLVQQGIDLAGTIRSTEVTERLTRMLEKREGNEGQLVAAVNALAKLDAGKHTPLLGKVLADSAQPDKVRETSANLLGGFNTAGAHEELVKAMQSVPAATQRTIAVAMAGTPNGSEKLLQAVATGKASALLLQERPVEVRLRSHKLANFDALYSRLTEGLPKVDERLNDLMKKRRTGFQAAKADLAQGAKVFEQRCGICHQLSGKGTKIGPQLDGIGSRGLDRLLEDTLDPNRNVDQAFRTTVLNLKSGQVVSGLLLREEGAVLVMADANGKEVRVPKDTVEERITSPLSPMPANLTDQVPEAEFYHLITYLLSQKSAGK